MTPQGPFDPNRNPGPGQPPYGYPQAPPPNAGYPVQANGSVIMALGIISLFVMGMILGPISWVMGNNALAAIDSGRANPAERDNVNIGRTCGIIGTAIHVFVILGWIIWMVFIAVMFTHAATAVQHAPTIAPPPTFTPSQ